MALTTVSAPRLRLTRRGRLAVVLTTLLACVVGFSAEQVSSQAASSVRHVQPRTITVQQGETLWQVAARIAPHTDPRLVVDQIQRINHLASPQLLAGMQLVVPRAR